MSIGRNAQCSIQFCVAGDGQNSVPAAMLPPANGGQQNFMDWLYLLIAGLLEVGWAIGLKYTQGFTRLWPSIGTIVCMAVSFFFLSLALKTIPIGTGYAVWTGIGAVGTAILGMALLGEPRDVGRIACLVLIVSGIAGLKLMAADGK